MKYCKKCVTPDTKPGIVFDKEGVCPACRHAEKKKLVDWKKRFGELKKLCNKYRRKDGYYDCMIAVSGGKDSHYQIYVIKELLGMNPLLVSAASTFSLTETGRRNFLNMGDSFGCDIIILQENQKASRIMTRVGFEEWGRGAYPIDTAIYVFPIRVAINYNIPLVIYGENVSYEYGGTQDNLGETYSALDQIYNTVTYPLDLDFWKKKGLSEKDLNAFIYPTKEEIQKAKLDPMYLSYFVPWDGYYHYQIAKQYGFRTIHHEWRREGWVDEYSQIDTIGYLIDEWLKYPKFGFGNATNYASRWVRNGSISREEATELVRKYDHVLDERALDDFLNFTRYKDKEFWDIVEKFWNQKIFEKIDGVWRMKENCKIK